VDFGHCLLQAYTVVLHSSGVAHRSTRGRFGAQPLSPASLSKCAYKNVIVSPMVPIPGYLAATGCCVYNILSWGW
jgi:hypothetical protein